MRKLTLAEADTIIDAALAKGRDLELGKLSVVVLDDGGHQIAMKREDGSEFMRPLIANAKAWGALGMGQSSRTLRDRLAERPHFIASLAAASGGRFIAVPGGVLIRDDGDIIGAVGATGRAKGVHLDWRLNWFDTRLDPALVVGPMPGEDE